MIRDKIFKLLKNRVNRMQMFIQSLLEYSRVGRVKTPPEMFAVKDLLVDIIDSLAPPATFTIAISGLYAHCQGRKK